MSDPVVIAAMTTVAALAGALFREAFAWLRDRAHNELDADESIRIALYREIDRLTARVASQDGEIELMKTRITHLEDENLQLILRLGRTVGGGDQ